jgi:hypothetical protein
MWMMRRWLRRAGVALLAVLGVLGLILLGWPGPASETGKPTLPAVFATYSMFTAHAEDRPAGRAIALFEMGSWEFSSEGTRQAVVAGADRDSYRRVDAGEWDKFGLGRLLLSPDGGHVLRQRARGGPGELELLDLRTGETSPRHGFDWTPPVPTDLNRTELRNVFLAWSPDGRYVAYAIRVAVWGAPDVPSPRELVVLDLVTDRATYHRGISGVWNAAFSPDSRRLAVATDSGGIIVSLDGERLGTWSATTLGSGETLRPPQGASGLAWSPDGALLAVASNVACGRRADMTGGGPTMTFTTFVDMTTGLPVSPQPRRPCLEPLGWRSPTLLVGEQIRPDGGYGLAEADLTTEVTTPISHFSYTPGCELISRCDVWRIQLATNLLPAAGMRDSLYPDRGPWVIIVHGALVSLPMAFAAWLFVPLIVERVRERRARRQPPGSPQPKPDAVGVST